MTNAARTAAKAQFRTVHGQVEFWAQAGRAALDNPGENFYRNLKR
jgi:hypothetical protein